MIMSRTFSITTLGCKVNAYESEQIATLLRGRGWVRVEAGDAGRPADLRVVQYLLGGRYRRRVRAGRWHGGRRGA